jgi:hypothetical protein
MIPRPNEGKMPIKTPMAAPQATFLGVSSIRRR